MSWRAILLLAAGTFGVIVLFGSRFSGPSVSVGGEGPTVTPSGNNGGSP